MGSMTEVTDQALEEALALVNELDEKFNRAADPPEVKELVAYVAASNILLKGAFREIGQLKKVATEAPPGSPMIYRLIGTILSELGAISKDMRNADQGFQYRGIDQFYNAINPLFSKYKVFTVPQVLERQESEYSTAGGKIWKHVVLKVSYRLCAPDGSFVEGIVFGEGNDSGDKGSNKALAIAHKYFLMQTFAVATEDLVDPDGQMPAEKVVTSKPAQPAGKPTVPKPAAATAAANLAATSSQAPSAPKGATPEVEQVFDAHTPCARAGCGDAWGFHGNDGAGQCAGKEGKCNCPEFLFPESKTKPAPAKPAAPKAGKTPEEIVHEWKLRVDACKTPQDLFKKAHVETLPSDLQTKENRDYFWANYQALKKTVAGAKK